MITIDDFAKLEFKVGTVISAEEIEGSEKLLKLRVDFGPKVQNLDIVTLEEQQNVTSSQQDSTDRISAQVFDSEEGALEAQTRRAEIHTNNSSSNNSESEEQNDIRQILSGIKQWFKPEDLVGKQFVFITNLAPRKMMGLESQGMIMAAEGEDRPAPLTPIEKVPNGSKIR